jgi:hypothetical protein
MQDLVGMGSFPGLFIRRRHKISLSIYPADLVSTDRVSLDAVCEDYKVMNRAHTFQIHHTHKSINVVSLAVDSQEPRSVKLRYTDGAPACPRVAVRISQAQLYCFLTCNFFDSFSKMMGQQFSENYTQPRGVRIAWIQGSD